MSSEGANGEWTDVLKCQTAGDFLTGVKLKSENWGGWGKLTRQA